MIGLDTNVLIRYLVADDPVQFQKASKWIGGLTEERPGFISAVVMAETVWVLEAVYGFGDDEIASTVQRILQVDAFVVQHAYEVFVAMTVVRQHRGSFADALIGAINTRAGCSKTVTFDRKASRLPSFQLL